MVENLRHRSVGVMTTASRSNKNNDTFSRSSPIGPKNGLTRDAMQEASPQHTGNVMKLHIPLFYSILPEIVQNFITRTISKYRFLSFLLPLLPTWKARYIIILGSFLYKFTEDGVDPKGSPILIQSLDIQLLDINELLDIHVDFPKGYAGFFCISNLRKKYYFACKSHDDARAWVNSIRDARKEAITRSMGHAPKDSYPTKWNYFDSLGRSLLNSKERIRVRMEQNNNSEMELASLSSGSVPRGYFG